MIRAAVATSCSDITSILFVCLSVCLFVCCFFFSASRSCLLFTLIFFSPPGRCLRVLRAVCVYICVRGVVWCVCVGAVCILGAKDFSGFSQCVLTKCYNMLCICWCVCYSIY